MEDFYPQEIVVNYTYSIKIYAYQLSRTSMKKIKNRIEHDSLGAMEVPNNKYWGAQTQRSLINFNIGQEIVSLDLIHAVAAIK
jgi:hypothetical protein